MSRQNLLVVMVAMVIGAGCSQSSSTGTLKPSPVSTGAFYRPTPGAEDPHDSPVDRGGAIVAPVEAQRPVQRIEPAQSPKPAATPAPVAAGSTTGPAGGTTAQYLTIGAVVIEVSGTPIYADKVLQALTPMLSTEAKQRDIDSFRVLAQSQISIKVRDMINTEVTYAAAIQNLTTEEKARADAATTEWRKHQISAAGGSEARARAKAQAEGISFDERAREQYRRYIIELWYTKKIFPRVEVTPEDIRRYYDLHHEKQFSDTAKAQFRVIKITAASVGGVDQARAKINELHQQALQQSDEEFAKTAGSINDPSFMRTQGRVGGGDGWVEKGAFAISPLEDALWKIQPGQVTDVVQVGDAFYIARLENRRDARTRMFEDPDVQAEIYSILSQPQIADQRDRMQNKLLENAVFNPPVQLTQATLARLSQPVLEMVMQEYPAWAAK